MEQYIAVYSKEYDEEYIRDLIDADNVIRHYSPQTYWEPGEDSIEFEATVDKEFYNIVKVAKLHFFYDNDYPFAAIVNGFTWCLGENENWQKTLEAAGWKLFDNELSEDYENDAESVESNIQEWIDGIAEKRAWDYIDNLKYGDY